MSTTAKERYEVLSRLEKAGISYEHANALRRISMTLSRWSELDWMIEHGKGTLYLHREPWRTNDKGEHIRSNSHDYVSNWVGTWKGKAFTREGYSYGFCRVKTYWVWFTGPDGKQWYGVCKGDQECFNVRRLKTQPKKGR